MKFWGLKLGVTSAVVVACTATPAFADGADDLQDFVGARGGQAEMGLQQRGYEHVETHTAGNVRAAYWWNEEADDCVLIRTSDGRYQSIIDASDQDCGHHEGNAVGALAVAGIGVALVAALASHHHSNDDHGDNDSDSRDYRAQYDRGFSDGLHNSAYYNYDRSDGYSNGYNAGVQQRDHNLSHRRRQPNRGGHSQNCPADLRGNECEYYVDGYRAGSQDGSAGMSMAYERHDDGYDSRFETYFARGYTDGWRATR